MELSKSVVNKLRCNKCKAYLSCAPVFLKTNRQSICGRCSSSMKDTIRNEPYEKLAHQMKFPCRYDKDGCEAMLLFANTKAHETLCKFRLYKCTVSADKKCTWRGARYRFYRHCRTMHKNDTVQNPYVLTHVTNDSMKTVLLTAFNMLFMLQFKLCYVTKTLQHFVCLIRNPVLASLYKYDLSIDNNAGLRICKTGQVEQTNVHKNIADVIELQPVLEGNIRDITITFSISLKTNIQEPTTVNVRCEVYRGMNELPVKFKKHQMFFCNNATVCQLCNRTITGHSFAMHYMEAHSAETYNAELMFRINVNSSWKWCIIEANFGRTLCKYRLDKTGFTLLVYTSLPGHMLYMYNCEVIIIHATNDRTLVRTADRKYQCMEDWYLHVRNEEISFCIVNSKVDIQINFTDPDN